MTDQDVLSVGFTEVLYGVVVANAIYELTFAVELRNVLLLLAFAFIVGDWVEYQFSIEQGVETPWKYFKALVLDITILVVWYFLTIISVGRIEWFFAVSAAFFFLQYLWDIFVLGDMRMRTEEYAEIELAVTFATLAALAIAEALPVVWLVILSGLLFLGRKIPVWEFYLAQASSPS